MLTWLARWVDMDPGFLMWPSPQMTPTLSQGKTWKTRQCEEIKSVQTLLSLLLAARLTKVWRFGMPAPERVSTLSLTTKIRWRSFSRPLCPTVVNQWGSASERTAHPWRFSSGKPISWYIIRCYACLWGGWRVDGNTAASRRGDQSAHSASLDCLWEMTAKPETRGQQAPSEGFICTL